jgi:nitroreductase
MDFSEVVRKRRMVRHYTDQPLEPDVVERVLANALRAPSAGFSQGFAFLVLTAEVDRARFWPFVPTRVENTPTMQLAPLVVVPLAHKGTYLERYAEPDKGWEDRAEAHWPAPYWYIDTGMAALMMLLTAVDEGLGACFFGIMPDNLQPFKDEFGVPDDYAPIGALTVGYRADDEPAPDRERLAARRRPPTELMHRGNWGQHLVVGVESVVEGAPGAGARDDLDSTSDRVATE